jgi:hypothetical protein
VGEKGARENSTGLPESSTESGLVPKFWESTGRKARRGPPGGSRQTIPRAGTELGKYTCVTGRESP